MNNNTSVVIMAGGFGTRFNSITKQMAVEHPDLFKDKDGNPFSDIPKPMALIGGIPVLEREIQCLVSQGFTNIYLTVSHLAEVIIDYFGDGSGISRATGKPFGCNITYYLEEKPLGNAGALYKINDKLTDDFLLLNADSIFDIDFNRMVKYHSVHNSLATLFAHPNSHPYDSGLLVCSEDCIVQSWLTKEDRRPEWYSNRVNAGIHVISRSALDEAAHISNLQPDLLGSVVGGKPYKIDLDRQILKPLCSTKRVYAYNSPEYVKDMGTPERFEVVVHDYKAGIVQAKNLSKRQRAIFLDRDGTINKYRGFLTNIDDFELIDGVANDIKRINASGYLAIIITNQPVIARGEVTENQLHLIHKKMETLLGQEGAYIDGIYYCPHHPDKGFEGEIPELKIDCECRKPKTGLIKKAVKDFNIDLGKSYFFGDGKNDILCGQNAGVSTCLYVGPDSDPSHRSGLKPDYICNSLDEFCDKIGI